MADVENQPSAATSASSAQSAGNKGKKTAKARTPRTKPYSHPPTSEMVSNAIKDLNDRGGSSLQAIKKYVAAKYLVDADKIAPFINKYVTGAVASGALVQTKGKGASGSFRLGEPVVDAKGKKSAVKRADEVAEKTAPSPKPKKAAAGKGTAAAEVKKGAAAKKSGVKAATKPKSPSKAKKSKAKKPRASQAKTVRVWARSQAEANEIVARLPPAAASAKKRKTLKAKTVRVWAHSAAEARQIVASLPK